MKNIIYLCLIALLFISCKEEKKATEPKTEPITIEKKTTLKYPKNLLDIFDAHGGIENWQKMKSLIFTMETKNGDEIIATNLKSREALLTNKNSTIGFDGSKVWLENKSKEKYKGYNPIYGYNLMFYFYAMPFILADDGINYKDAEPLVFEGQTYPGIEITYNSGVGETPEDRYVLYYNATTFNMEWLGYTVNFVEGIDKKELHFRRYKDWQNVNGLILPKSIVGYTFKNDKPIKPKGTNVFKDVKLSEKAFDLEMFKKTENGNYLN